MRHGIHMFHGGFALAAHSWTYASTNGVRMVKTASWPSNHGMKAGIINCDFDCTVAHQEARFTSNATDMPFFNNTGLDADAALNMTGLYRWVVVPCLIQVMRHVKDGPAGRQVALGFAYRGQQHPA